jgi:DNA-binding NarL/FixJ family response regulator
MSGIEFITEAKKIYQHVSFLILTGFDINNEIKRIFKKRFNNWIFSKTSKSI